MKTFFFIIIVVAVLGLASQIMLPFHGATDDADLVVSKKAPASVKTKPSTKATVLSSAPGLVSDPDEISKKLKAQAMSLSPTEIDSYKSLAADEGANADKRALALELLSQNETEQAVEALKELASQPLPKNKTDRLLDQERVFRAWAIEGLLQNPSIQLSKSALQFVVSKSEDSFISQRAEQALYWMSQGHDPAALEKVDIQAYRKLLSPKSHL